MALSICLSVASLSPATHAATDGGSRPLGPHWLIGYVISSSSTANKFSTKWVFFFLIARQYFGFVWLKPHPNAIRKFQRYPIQNVGCTELSMTTIKTIRYDSVCLTCSKKLTVSQLSLPHETNKKLKCKTKNKMMSMIGPVQSRYREAVQ